MSPTQVIVIVLVVLVVVAALAVVLRQAARRRALQARFGPEYDRTVAERDSRSAAERELRDRERRHAELTLTPLTPESRARYAAAWEELQVRFVDSPAETVSDADELVGRLVAERGYPTGEFSDQAAQLSVEHARTLSHYRDAHEIRLRNERGEAGTEELRQAVVHYRTLFADLLGEDPVGSRAPERGQPEHVPGHQPDATPEQRADATPTDRPHDATSR
ncbi:hypothetical protein [Micromonospora rubida]|uniref:hypothetical protein n=1 Tax=Micromonospora rubida TaxID=2697657 RepID=UPI001376BC3F|nr:hypothetical protein [Micromonospora rubida]NBE80427.1 hypothetical protein [Micromonospora rubida]